MGTLGKNESRPIAVLWRRSAGILEIFEKSSKLQGILIVVGTSFYWPMFRNHYLGVLHFGNATGDYSKTYTLLILLVMLAAFAAIIALGSTRFMELLNSKRWLVPGLAFVASFVAIVLVLIRLAEPAQAVVNLIAALFLAAHTALITISWGATIAQSRDTRMVFYLTLSFFLSFVISLCTQLPFPFNALLPVVGPPVCGICWFLLPKKTALWQAFTRAHMNPALWRTMLILILFLLVGSVVRGLYSVGVINYLPSIEGIIRPALSIVLSLLLCLTAYASSQRERLINVVWVVFVLLFFGGLFITAALMPGLSSIDSDIVVMSRTFLGFFLWVVITNVARSQRADPLLLLCVFFLITDCVSGLLTNYIVPYFTTQNPGFVEANIGILALLMAFILLLGTLGFLSTTAFKSAFAQASETSGVEGGGQGGGDASTEARVETCRRIALHCQLTTRETEVLSYLSQGHSTKKIAESLFISTSTVQSHIKSLYRKTECHTRQEIIDFVGEGGDHGCEKI